MKKSIFLFFAAILCAMSVQGANTMRIYCKQAQSWWKSDGAAVGAYYWGTGGNANSWPGTRMNKVSGQTDLWYIDVDIDKYQKIIFTRVNGSGSVSDWGAKTGDLAIANTKNQYTISSSSPVWGNPGVTGSWGTYKPTSTAALATSAANIFVGGQATLTSSLTSNADANTIKETAYAISPAGANVSGNTFTATAEGTYTVTATVTYYPLGCPTLTSTATAETTIEAEVPAEETHDVTVSYMCGETKLQDPTTVNTVGVETPVKVTAPEIAKYAFVNWTLGNDVVTSDALTATSINITTKAGGSDFTLMANYEKAKLTYTVTVPAGTENCYLVGAMNGWDVANPIEMTKQGENIFTTTLEGVATTDEYKYISQKGTWDYADVQEANRTWTANDVVTAWKDPLATNVHLVGNMFANWDKTPDKEFRKATKDATTASIVVTLEADKDYELKVRRGDDWTSCTSKITNTVSNLQFSTSNNDNCKMKTTVAGDYTFTWTISSSKLAVTYPTICTVSATANDAAMGTITGAGDYGKGSTATLTATPNDGYLFVNWTKGGEEVATTQEYSFKVTEAVALVANFEAAPEEVHNVTVSYVCGGNKIADDQTVAAVGETSAKTAEAPAIFGYTFDSWTLGADVTTDDALTSNAIDINIVAGGSDFTLTANYTEIPKLTVYFVNNKKWSKVHAYGWKDGEAQGTPAWPGQDIIANKETEKIAGFDVYSYSVVPGSYDNIIFNNNSGAQTETFKWTDGKYYYMGADENYAGGTAEEVEKALVDVYTIMGANELGLSWNLTTTGNDMTKQADGTYTLVKEGLDLATTGNYEYKVVKNHSWDWSIPSGNTNQTLKVDKDGTYTVTFTLSADKKKLTADAVCTAEKEVILDCFVAGTINLVGGTSDFTDKLAMTYDEGTKTYSKTFTALAAGDYQMKVVYGSDWLGYDKLTKPVPANVTKGDDNKIKFSLAEAGDVTVTYHATNGIGLTGNFAAPAPVTHTYTIAGSKALCGVDWKWGATENDMTNNGDGTYTWTKTDVVVEGNLEFKVFVDHKSESAYPSDNWVIKPENYEGKSVYNVTITFTESSKKIDVKLTNIKVTPSVVENAYFSVEDGKFVQFSTGNLQYEVGTNTWSFASEQYEVIGGAAYNPANPTNTNYGMNEPGYTGKLDLFGWSCDGKFGVNPSNADADYTGEFADWGKLVNETGWYTLTKDEMNYLLNRKKDGKKLWALATVCGMNGLILLPDNWNTSTTLEYGYVPADWNYTKNQFDDAAWAALEAAGAVFLPEGGTRVGGHGNKDQGGGPAEFDAHGDYFHVDNVGEMGYYWLNTQDARAGYENCASYLILPGWNNNGTPADESDDKALAPQVWSREKRRGNSVRLVKAIEPDHTRTVTSGDYGTICLPNGGLLLGASAFSVAKMEGTTILLDEVGTTMVAGTPYVVFPNTGASSLYVFYTDNVNADAGDDNGLYGSYERRELEANAGNYIMLPGNRYAEVTGDRVFVAANRAYFKLSEISPKASASAPGVRRIAISQAPQVATGMENIDASAQPVKTIINGQLFILRGEKMYDAQGKLVK